MRGYFRFYAVEQFTGRNTIATYQVILIHIPEFHRVFLKDTHCIFKTQYFRHVTLMLAFPFFDTPLLFLGLVAGITDNVQELHNRFAVHIIPAAPACFGGCVYPRNPAPFQTKSAAFFRVFIIDIFSFRGIFSRATFIAEQNRVLRIDFLHEFKKKAYAPMASATLM